MDSEKNSVDKEENLKKSVKALERRIKKIEESKIIKYQIWYPVLVGLLVFVLSGIIQDFFSPPKVIYVNNDMNNVCPNIIQFTKLDSNAYFQLVYWNKGKNDGSLTVELKSDQVVSRYIETESIFNSATQKTYFFGREQPSRFIFEVKLNQNLIENGNLKLKDDRITVIANAVCKYDATFIKNQDCGTLQLICNYDRVKEDNNQYTFKLTP